MHLAADLAAQYEKISMVGEPGCHASWPIISRNMERLAVQIGKRRVLRLQLLRLM